MISVVVVLVISLTNHCFKIDAVPTVSEAVVSITSKGGAQTSAVSSTPSGKGRGHPPIRYREHADDKYDSIARNDLLTCSRPTEYGGTPLIINCLVGLTEVKTRMGRSRLKWRFLITTKLKDVNRSERDHGLRATTVQMAAEIKHPCVTTRDGGFVYQSLLFQASQKSDYLLKLRESSIT